jgi:glyoxylase-like metal-dependent hydrolase (beta-lactamase superfamily II)
MMLPLMRAMPRRRRESIIMESNLEGLAHALDPEAGVPGLPDWECIPTPGHTPGHVAFFRRSDGVLIAGDAVVTVDVNSAFGFLLWALGRSKQELSGTPWYFTWSWQAATESVALLARLEPLVLTSGHGPAMSGPKTPQELRSLADRLAMSQERRRE